MSICPLCGSKEIKNRVEKRVNGKTFTYCKICLDTFADKMRHLSPLHKKDYIALEEIEAESSVIYLNTAI